MAAAHAAAGGRECTKCKKERHTFDGALDVPPWDFPPPLPLLLGPRLSCSKAGGNAARLAASLLRWCGGGASGQESDEMLGEAIEQFSN
jgi:hypothetical protein